MAMLWVRIWRICVSAYLRVAAYLRSARMCCLPWRGAVFAIWYPNECPGSVWSRPALRISIDDIYVLPSLKYRRYCGIIVLKPKILYNIVWTFNKISPTGDQDKHHQKINCTFEAQSNIFKGCQMPIPYLEQEHEKKWTYKQHICSIYPLCQHLYEQHGCATQPRCQHLILLSKQTLLPPAVTHPFPISATQHDLGNPNFWEREGKGGVGALEYATCNISSSGFKLSKLACKIGSRIEQGSQRSPMVRQEPLAADPNPHLPCPANIIAAPIRGRTLANSTLGTASSNGTIAHATARVGKAEK